MKKPTPNPEYLKRILNKLESIPNSAWTTGTVRNALGQRCTLGHCSYQERQGIRSLGLLDTIMQVNDGTIKSYKWFGLKEITCPKERIVRWLRNETKEGEK